jgi:M61 glycyl aminopeptidase
VPAGWKVASGLDDRVDSMVFSAPDYDTLVDQPNQMGHFDVTRFTVQGKPHEFVANPAGAFSAETTRTFIGHLTKLAETEGKILLMFCRRPRVDAELVCEFLFTVSVAVGSQRDGQDATGQESTIEPYLAERADFTREFASSTNGLIGIEIRFKGSEIRRG